MIRNFRYELPNQIAVSSVPETPEDAEWLHAEGIRSVLSLHPVPAEAHRRLTELGMRWYPYVIEDFPNVPLGFHAALDFMVDAVATDPPLLIHCHGGGGRSGVLLAAYLIRRGLPTEEAVERVPGVGGERQSAFLFGFAAGMGR